MEMEKVTEIKSMATSYLSNLLGVTLALLTATMVNSGASSPLEFSSGEWLAMVNGLWAAAVPTILRYVNKKDPAFGLVAVTITDAVSKKLSSQSKAPRDADGDGKIFDGTPKEMPAPVKPRKKPTPKSGGGGAGINIME